MHKGCVIEIRKNTMVVMTEDCDFTEVKKKNNVEVGMEIKFNSSDIIKPKGRQIQPWVLVAASILLVVVTSLYGVNLWQQNLQAYALITVDINPSIQIEVNANNQVIRAMPLNAEAETLNLEGLKRKSIEVALDHLVEASKEQGYIKLDDENYILIARVLLKDQGAGLKELEAIIEASKEKIEQKAIEQEQQIAIISIEAGSQSLTQAIEEKVSVGRFKMYEEFKTISAEEEELERMKEKGIGELIRHINKPHPVFEQHPGNGQQQDKVKDHPVFDQHPGSKEKTNDQEKQPKEHPVFDQHPGNRSEEGKEKEHPVFDEHPGNGNPKDKEHPIFDEHPGNKQRTDRQGQLKDAPVFESYPDNNDQIDKAKDHPVFQQHPSEKEKSNEVNKQEKQENEKEKSHPVFDQHPGNQNKE